MLKKEFKHGWSQIPNQILSCNKLSFKAKGLWSYINSKPENWDFAVWRISQETNEGEKSIRSGLKELVDSGYLEYRAKKGIDNKFNGQDYILKDVPDFLGNHQIQETPKIGDTETGGHISNTELNKKELSIIPQNKFEEFWTLYPRKTGKGKAKQSYQKATAKIKEVGLVQALKDRLEDLGKLEPQFIPHPSTWLNQERWEDEIINKPVIPATEQEVAQRKLEWERSLERSQSDRSLENANISYFKPLNLF